MVDDTEVAASFREECRATWDDGWCERVLSFCTPATAGADQRCVAVYRQFVLEGGSQTCNQHSALKGLASAYCRGGLHVHAEHFTSENVSCRSCHALYMPCRAESQTVEDAQRHVVAIMCLLSTTAKYYTVTRAQVAGLLRGRALCCDDVS